MKKNLLICLSLLVGILLLEKYTNWDLLIQNKLYDFSENAWLITKIDHNHLRFFFYEGIKVFTVIIGLSSLVLYVLSFKFEKYSKYKTPALLLFLSIVLVPSIISSAKLFTNVYCPLQLDLYGGDKPFVRIIDKYPEDYVQIKEGRCFPAGHATAGFCMMALYFCFTQRKYKIAGLSFGIILGFITSAYQMLRGQHFLSHSVFTMVLSIMIILVINHFIKKRNIYERT